MSILPAQFSWSSSSKKRRKTWGCGGDGEGIDRLQHFLRKHWR